MKNIYPVAAALILLATPALAATKKTEMRTTPDSGLYVGGFGGYDWTDLDTSIGSADIGGWEGGVFAGYKLGGFMKDIGISGAVEGFYGWSGSDGNFASTSVEKDQEWGVSFRPGFSFIDKAMDSTGISPYAILGYRNTEFQGSSLGITGSEWYDGFELGLGTELIAMGDFGIRAEYSHVWYAAENGVDPDSDNLRIGLAYHF